jgi:hypothetical protein
LSAIASNLSELVDKSSYKVLARAILSASAHAASLGNLNSSSTVLPINSLAWSRSATHQISTTI